MKAFNKIFMAVIGALAILFAAANIILSADSSDSGRPYRVEINRLARQIETDGHADISECKYVTGIEEYGGDFFSTDSDYAVREINGVLYRFDYRADSDRTRLIVTADVILGVMAVLVISVILYIKFRILAPFERLTDVPYELSKGILTVPVKETKNHFFGRFIWGVDMLRENIEQQKKRELDLQKDKKMLLLSLSHDIKTPLSAIKLYAKALSKGLYESREKQLEIAESINAKADEIECYV
ncbi:MAG: sensor histidine kinase, partial [Oscillospiraceae bacterium]|nr:sensor histidine kinase [Oscillospiraceae bacterium]